jgi:hypothetical protein
MTIQLSMLFQICDIWEEIGMLMKIDRCQTQQRETRNVTDDTLGHTKMALSDILNVGRQKNEPVYFMILKEIDMVTLKYGNIKFGTKNFSKRKAI